MTKRSLKVITFDLDNTLWDVEPALLRAEQAQLDWLQEFRPRVLQQFNTEQMREFRFRVYELNPQLAHQISELRIRALYELQLHCDYPEIQAREGAQSAFDAFLHYRHQVKPYERAVEILQQLSANYILGALTNGNADIFKLEVGDYFDFAFSAEELNASKPMPDMFHASMRETSAKANQMVHVGDNPEHDVHGAQQVGMFTVWMNSGGWRWPEARPPADLEIKQLEQLPAAIENLEARVTEL